MPRACSRPVTWSASGGIGREAPAHGWVSADVLRVGQGSLYPALYRLEAEGLIRAEWGTSDNNRKARYYELTPAGRKRLTAEMDHWTRITAAVNAVLAKA